MPKLGRNILETPSCKSHNLAYIYAESMRRKYCSRHLYVADLVSLPAERSKGYGQQLYSYLEDQARTCGCRRCSIRLQQQ